MASVDVSMAGYLTPAQTKLFIESESDSEISEEIANFYQ